MRVAAGIASMAPAGCRPVFIAGLYLLGIANGAVGSVTSSIISKGFWGALSATFDLSIVALAATVVGLKLTLRTPDRPIDGLDRLVAAVYVISLCIPSGSVSMAGVTFLAFYECLRSFRSVETHMGRFRVNGVWITISLIHSPGASDPSLSRAVTRARFRCSCQTHIRSSCITTGTNIPLAAGRGSERARPICSAAVQTMSRHGRPTWIVGLINPGRLQNSAAC